MTPADLIAALEAATPEQKKQIAMLILELPLPWPEGAAAPDSEGLGSFSQAELDRLAHHLGVDRRARRG